MAKKKVNKINIVFPILGILLIVIAGILQYQIKNSGKKILNSGWITNKTKEIKTPEVPIITEVPTKTPSPTVKATPKPATVESMNKEYGPCAKVNVLMYHHIQDENIAKEKGQTSLTVTPEFFKKHLEYLRDNGYSVITMAELKNFFSGGIVLPKKSVMITVDDGYKDNYEVMYPILKEFGFKATVFVATGLLNNPEYMSWGDLNQMKDLVYFGNHTWSHHSSAGTKEKQTEEITLADKQLSEHGLNDDKIFAYPYGGSSKIAKEVLTNNSYQIAFTTVHGNILCRGKSLELPRIRVGNSSLRSYGL
ncbi:MAG: polysaccharide deacetylase family protein [Candidatus Shapirobacteria bacterium]|nr:polysaccharide deacetylase family protein [Candidatus Shapirobacteria bacterium]